MPRFELVLDDKLSPPARGALASIERLDRSLRTLDTTLNRVGGTMGRVGGGGSGGGGGSFLAGAANLSVVGTTALSAAQAIGRIGLAFGRNVVQLAAFRQSSLAALSTVTGSAEMAQGIFREAISIANETPLDTQAVVGSFQRYIVAGFDRAESRVLTRAGSDLAAAFGQERADSFTLVASQLRASGRANRGDLTQLLNSGVNTGAVLDSVARQLGLHGSSAEATRNAVLDRLSKHGVTGDQLLQGALDAISQRLDRGGALGGFAIEQSRTLTGAISNAENAWGNLLLSVASEKFPGLERFSQAVVAITGALDSSQPAGRELLGIVEDVINVLGEGLFGDINERSINGLADTLSEMRPVIVDVVRGIVEFGKGFGGEFSEAVGQAIDLFRQLSGDGESSAETWRDFGRAVGWVAGTVLLGAGVVIQATSGIVEAFDAIGEIPDDLRYIGTLATEAFDEFVTSASQAGDAVIDGLVEGITSGASRVIEAINETLDGAIDGARDILGWHSPSTVFRDAGESVTTGFELGVGDGAGRVNRAIDGVLSIGQVPAAAGFGARPSINLGGVVIQVVAHPGEDAEEFGRRAGRGFVGELADVFELLNAGPAPAPAATP